MTKSTSLVWPTNRCLNQIKFSSPTILQIVFIERKHDIKLNRLTPWSLSIQKGCRCHLFLQGRNYLEVLLLGIEVHPLFGSVAPIEKLAYIYIDIYTYITLSIYIYILYWFNELPLSILSQTPSRDLRIEMCHVYIFSGHLSYILYVYNSDNVTWTWIQDEFKVIS